jgi:hypothetical protein
MTHPATESALSYIKSKPDRELRKWLDVFDKDDSDVSAFCFQHLHAIIDGDDELLLDIDIIALAYVMEQGEG